MTLTVINSNSRGNCYILTAHNGDVLILEAGCNIELVKRALGFNFSKVLGVLITHHHKDHCKYVNDFLQLGIRVYSTIGELEMMDIPDRLGNFAMSMRKEQLFTLGDFKIKFFPINHGTKMFPCPDPVGFLISHPESGIFPFITDTFFIEYTFAGMSNIIVETNYSREIIDRNVRESGADIKQVLRDRVIQSHLSIDNAIKWLRLNDLAAVNNIVLIHLSDSNSDGLLFKAKIEQATGKTVTIAKPGVKLNWNKHPIF